MTPSIRLSAPGVPAAVAACAAALAAVGIVGADLPWLVPLGGEVVRGTLPHSIAAATASTAGWHDPIAASQVAAWAAYHALGGDRGLLLLQALAAAAGFGLLAAGARRQSSDGAALAASLIVLVGGASAVLVARVSLFSLALFPLLLWLLEEDARFPSRRIWGVVPLIGVWANLHGLVLVGVGLVLAYLAFDRGRREPALAAGVAAASIAALFATPALLSTPLYYRGVFENEAAARGVGLWQPLGLGPFDLLYVAAALVLIGVGRRRFRLYEAASVVVLGVASVHTARMGLWLLFVAAYPAARAFRLRAPRRGVVTVLACGFALVAIAALARPDHDATAQLARVAARTDQVVLAEPLGAERVALYGGRVWVANPIDAFSRSDQRLYLDWVAGRASGAGAVAHAQLVLVDSKSPAGRVAARDDRLRKLRTDGGVALYAVRSMP